MPGLRRLAFALFACLPAGLPGDAWASTGPVSRLPHDVRGEPAPVADLPMGGATLVETFDNVAGSPDGCPPGWTCVNRSAPAGTTGWLQGAPIVFPAQAGPPEAYIAANFSNGGGLATISNWLISPEVAFYPGASLRFWTRTVGNSVFADRLEVRISTAGASTDVGTTAGSVGDFALLVAVVNPQLVPPSTCPPGPGGGYPSSWCEFVVDEAAGLPINARGRIAFRYSVPNAGPNGFNADYIGIDSVTFVEGDAPTDLAVQLATDGGAATEPGDAVRFTATVVTLGPGDASGVQASIELSPLLAYVGNDCGGTLDGRTLRWNPSVLLQGQSSACRVDTRMQGRGTVTTVAQVAGSENDPDPANNRAIAGFSTAFAVPAIARGLLAALGLAVSLAALAAIARSRRHTATRG